MDFKNILKKLTTSRRTLQKEQMLDTAYNAASSRRSAFAYYNPTSRPIDSEIINNIDTMRSRSRDIIRNSSIGSGIIKLMSRGVIGDGLRLMPALDNTVLNLSQSDLKRLEKQIEQEFRIWAESESCDSEDSLDFYAMQDLVFSSYLENGDVFALLTHIKNSNNDYTLSVNIIESDMCVTPLSLKSKAGIIMGVEKNSVNAPISYYFKKLHAVSENDAVMYFNNQEMDYRKIPARDNNGKKQILHIFKKVRAGQSRGIPFLAPVLEQLKQIERYADSELMASVISSKFTVFVKTPDGESIAPDSLIDEDIERPMQNKDIALQDGAIIPLARGQEIDIANPARPNTAFAEFISFTIKKIGMGLALPYEVLMQSFTASYSASRGSLLEAEKTFLKYRKEFINKFCTPIYERFFDEMVRLGKISAPNYHDPLYKKAYLGAVWIAPKKSSIDELKEVNAAIARIEAGLSNKSIEALNLTGVRWEQVIERRKQELEIEKNIYGDKDDK